MNISVVIPARNEAERLPLTLEALRRQTLRPTTVIVVDDGSTDGTGEIAREHGCVVVRNPVRHEESWVGRPELSLVFNLGVARVPRGTDYMVMLGADTVLEKRYLEKVVGAMERDPGIVIASGVVVGEGFQDTPRGSGRVYRYEWWRRHIGLFPLCYMWESYPLYKALAQGYRVEVVPDAKMYVSRRTRSYKAEYGYAMRELGYLPPYAVLRSLAAMLSSPKTGVKMLATYLARSFKTVDREVAGWIRRYQAKLLLEALTRPGTALKRLK